MPGSISLIPGCTSLYAETSSLYAGNEPILAGFKPVYRTVLWPVKTSFMLFYLVELKETCLYTPKENIRKGSKN